jgi:hypothetical protein
MPWRPIFAPPLSAICGIASPKLQENSIPLGNFKDPAGEGSILAGTYL